MSEQRWPHVEPHLGELVRSVQHLSQRSVELAEHLQDASAVNHTDFRALTHVQANPGITAGDLATRLDRTPAATSTVLDRLERAGHVERRPDPDDRRRTTLWVTELPRRVAAETLRPFVSAVVEEFADEPPEELQRTAAHLDRITAVMRAHLDDQHASDDDADAATPG
jgi:DNA-binding MarR family transcriptional regulator